MLTDIITNALLTGLCLRTQLNLHGGFRIAHIACGAHHSVLLTETGSLFAWGRNKAGQLGEPLLLLMQGFGYRNIC
jgi:alpha-tubulin suppressor-like RCC1 family protein